MSTIITHKTFPNYKKYEMELAGRPFSIEVGKYAELANAAAMVKYGETTWLCAIAKNQFQSWQRKRWRSAEPLDETTPDSRAVEPDVLRRLDYLSLLQQIHTLPELTREVMYLRLFGQLSFQEIGEVLGRSENWARVTYYRGKEKVKKELTEHED